MRGIRPQSGNVTTCRCLAGTSIDTVSKAGKHDSKIGTSKSGQTKTNGLFELFLPIVGSEDIIERASCVCGPAGQDIGSKRCPRKCAGPGGAMSGLLLISRIACWSRVVLPIRRHPANPFLSSVTATELPNPEFPTYQRFQGTYAY